ncbi:MAG: alpha/beta fold hydrolase [Chloroflexi bacterium]|uniref:Alpha/beta fold hydrolase n=1 Tax=Candidatus Chlorohelix allophototropha TaxID=3003348 RepID=A0A8T7M6F8_9CHLR|nr:alpha/beta fold hydrolase [Chloroflexota bacterium]WJW69567.1 alpha/beta fold hydrolase [Chloroflexota bacterium L227-S17]
MRATNFNKSFEYIDTYERNRQRLRTAVKAISVAGGGATALVTTISAFVGYKAVRPRRRVNDKLVAPLPPEKVDFKSVDGLTLKGYFYPGFHPNGATIIILHGFHGAAIDVHEPALTMQAAGFNALIFDFRGCGASGGHTTSVGYYEVRDLLGAISYVKTRADVDATRIGVYGFSMGGATALMTTAISPDIKAVITDSAFASLDAVLKSSFKYFYRLPRFPFKPTTVLASRVFSRTVLRRIHPVESLRKLSTENRKIPILFIHTDNDPAIPVSEAVTLYSAYTGPKELWIVEGSGHIAALQIDRDIYTKRIVSFFDVHLGRKTSLLPLV